MSTAFQALYLDGKDPAAFRELTTSDLQDGDVLVSVEYSSLNYKDGLAITGKGKVIRKFPMIPGIDLAGTVVESSSPDYKPGDKVVAVGQGLGETRWGGYSQMQRVSSSALNHIPAPLDTLRSMAVGTAGFTAMLAILELERMNVRPSDREVIVTGATGGVGSVAVILLSQLGYKVAASTGRPENHDYLRSLGATTIVDRATLEQKGPPLAPERWAGGIDSVGGQTLASVIASTVSYGAVAACGLVGGIDLPTTVFPFILRNVALLGISSPLAPKPLREQAWSRLAHTKLDTITTVEPMSNLPALAAQIIAAQIRGRTVIKNR
jgi:putative YhdH/YhfP family quinone oxidoreductase